MTRSDAVVRLVADAALAVAVVLATWSAVAPWYVSVPLLDDAAHAVTPGAGAAVALHLLVGAGALPGPGSAAAQHHRWVPVLWTGLLGGAVALVWELVAWVAEQVAPGSVVVGYDDTVLDLGVGLLGALVAGALVARRWHRPAGGGRPGRGGGATGG